MEIKFNRSFIGYNPESLEELLESLDRDFKKELEKLKIKLADEVHQLELMRVENKKVKEEIDYYKSLKNEISHALADAHMVAVEKIFRDRKDLERIEKSAAEMAQIRQAELVKFRTDLEKMREEIYSVAGYYKSILDKAEGE